MEQKGFGKLIPIAILLLVPSLAKAQQRLSGSFESNCVYYLNDHHTEAVVPENNLGSNNYLKLDFQYGKFKAGVQYEAYLPVLQGLPPGLRGSDVVLKYASFQDSNLSITAGDFYDQFGNGLIFRAYEERALGLNTAVEGVHIAYSFGDVAFIKGLAGRSHEFMERAGSTVKGASLLVDLAPVLRLQHSSLTAEANYINRYESYDGQSAIDPNVNAYSFKGNWIRGGITLQGEYAYKTADPSTYNGGARKDGSALLLELGYTAPGFGSSLSFRRLEYMQFGTSRGIGGIGRDLNYLPALTRLYSYSLANLYPHNTMGNGEIGGQLDLQYQIRRCSKWGGHYGTKISLNASTYYNLKGDASSGFEFFSIGDTRYYQDINLDIEKRISPSLSLQFLYANQVHNPVVIGKENTLYFSQVAVTDLTWKAAADRAFRFEMQHLWSQDHYKNWAAALTEFSVSSWTCFVSDMYNYGDTRVHYYSAGCGYNVSHTRFSVNYGRNREGVICAGGVCLYMPAYTGFNLSITSSF